MSVSAEIADLWGAGAPLLYLVTGEEDDRARRAKDAAAGVPTTMPGAGDVIQGVVVDRL